MTGSRKETDQQQNDPNPRHSGSMEHALAQRKVLYETEVLDENFDPRKRYTQGLVCLRMFLHAASSYIPDQPLCHLSLRPNVAWIAEATWLGNYARFFTFWKSISHHSRTCSHWTRCLLPQQDVKKTKRQITKSPPFNSTCRMFDEA